MTLYKAIPTESNPYGFKGQIALREQFVMTQELRHLLETKDTTLSAQTIEEMAVKGGMLTMLQNGALKVLAGETTFDEIFRVVG